jgi:holo-[acyl-carrier protein] synthase
VGIDLVSVDHVEGSVRVHAGRYLQRVYTERELPDCTMSDGAPDYQRPAGRFAAEEATPKVLRSADEAVPWRTVGLRSRAYGAAALELAGAGALLARRHGVESQAVSLTHEGPFAAAIVVANVGESR